MDTAFLIVRLILGFGVAAHGAQKLFGWLGGGGMDKTAAFVSQLGFQPATLFALGAGLCEFIGGTLTALGFLGPVGPALVIIVMATAIVSVHWPNGFFATRNGIELPLYVAAGVTMFAVAGHGSYALDALLGTQSLFTMTDGWLAVGGGIFAAMAGLALRRTEPVTRNENQIPQTR
jgi:putative oxidoreductase